LKGHKTKQKVVKKGKSIKKEVVNQSIEGKKGYVGIIKEGPIFGLPELKHILCPGKKVGFLPKTLNVLVEGLKPEDGLVPLVLINVITENKLIIIDLAKLKLSKKNKNYLISLKILPANYFQKVDKFYLNINNFFNLNLLKGTGESYVYRASCKSVIKGMI
jgi:hypothetical protein